MKRSLPIACRISARRAILRIPRLAQIWMLACIIVTAAPHALSQDTDGIHIERETRDSTLILTATTAAFEMILTLEHRDRMLHLQVTTPIPLDRQQVILRALLEALHASSATSSDVDSLFVGRLIQYPEFSRRLARAAAESTSWDPTQIQTIPEQAVQLARDHRVFAEWQAVFLEFGLRIAVTHMEKVLIGTAQTHIPFADWLSRHGVPPDRQLPFDAMTFFSVEAVPTQDSKSGPSP